MAQIVQVDAGVAVISFTFPDSALFGAPASARELIVEVEKEFVELALLDVAGHLAELAPKNFGTLGQSFQAYPAGVTGGIELSADVTTGAVGGRVFSSLPYAVVMDAGRRPGRPISRAGVAAIALWVRRKLGLTGREAQSATYAIAWSIRTRGIVGTNYVRRALAKASPRLDGLFREMSAAIVAGLTRRRTG